MPYFDHDDIRFRYLDIGSGIPFIFQHGLGADVKQIKDIFEPPTGFRMVTFDCRGHGETKPLGPEDKISLATSADDMLALFEHLGIRQAVVGGISMGAAIALRFALNHSQRCLGLVQVRPAWLNGPLEQSIRGPFAEVATYIRRFGVAEGRAKFPETDVYREMQKVSQDCADSLLRQFDHPRAAETVVKLERIPADCPTQSLEEVRQVQTPTLVLANHHDPIHPFEYGETLAKTFPNARLHEITSKSTDIDQHQADVQKHVEEFLKTLLGSEGND